MKALKLLKTLVAAALISLLANLPAAAEVRVPKTGDVVECTGGPFMGGAVFVVECLPRWSGFVVADPVINGHSGLMFCSYDAVGHLCPEAANIYVKDHPEPLAIGVLSCTADWGRHEDVLRFDCTQE